MSNLEELIAKHNFNILEKEFYVTALHLKDLDTIRNIKPIKVRIKLNSKNKGSKMFFEYYEKIWTDKQTVYPLELNKILKFAPIKNRYNLVNKNLWLSYLDFTESLNDGSNLYIFENLNDAEKFYTYLLQNFQKKLEASEKEILNKISKIKEKILT